MNVAKKVLMIVGGAASCVAALVYFILGIVFITMANNEDVLDKSVGDSSLSPEDIKVLFIALGVCFFIAIILCIINAIIAFKGANSNSKKLMILNIVFGALSSVSINIVGAIFGLITISKENNKPKEIE